jgi:hypothetical protein
MILDRDASKQSKRFKKNFVHFCLAANIIKMERTQDKQVINITESLMNRINELILPRR